jgi:nicotinamide-nucleotide amidase
MKSIVDDHLWKALADLFDVKEVRYRVVMTAGEAESVLAGKISEWESAWRQKGISLAYLPQPGMVRLRLTDKGAGAEGIEQAVQELKLILPKEIFSTEGESLAEVTGRMLLEKKYTLAVAESCTGGRISSLITQIPGASEWFRGGVVAYSNDLKQQFAGVTADTLNRYGAVSQETVREMAEGIRQSTGATIGLSVSGIAGPGGGTDAKPVGTVWIGISGPNGSFQKVFHFGNMREINIARASMVALNTVRLHLLV